MEQTTYVQPQHWKFAYFEDIGDKKHAWSRLLVAYLISLFRIDLIFGFKQTGDAAVRAINVFHPATYRGRDLEMISVGDEVSLSALRTMIRTYGQMPTQLFGAPHLPHLEGKPSSVAADRSILPSVQGIRWGEFVGSPDTEDKLCSSPSSVFNLEVSDKYDCATHNLKKRSPLLEFTTWWQCKRRPAAPATASPKPLS